MVREGVVSRGDPFNTGWVDFLLWCFGKCFVRDFFMELAKKTWQRVVQVDSACPIRLQHRYVQPSELVPLDWDGDFVRRSQTRWEA